MYFMVITILDSNDYMKLIVCKQILTEGTTLLPYIVNVYAISNYI